MSTGWDRKKQSDGISYPITSECSPAHLQPSWPIIGPHVAPTAAQEAYTKANTAPPHGESSELLACLRCRLLPLTRRATSGRCCAWAGCLAATCHWQSWWRGTLSPSAPSDSWGGPPRATWSRAAARSRHRTQCPLVGMGRSCSCYHLGTDSRRDDSISIHHISLLMSVQWWQDSHCCGSLVSRSIFCCQPFLFLRYISKWVLRLSWVNKHSSPHRHLPNMASTLGVLISMSCRRSWMSSLFLDRAKQAPRWAIEHWWRMRTGMPLTSSRLSMQWQRKQSAPDGSHSCRFWPNTMGNYHNCNWSKEWTLPLGLFLTLATHLIPLLYKHGIGSELQYNAQCLLFWFLHILEDYIIISRAHHTKNMSIYSQQLNFNIFPHTPCLFFWFFCTL